MCFIVKFIMTDKSLVKFQIMHSYIQMLIIVQYDIMLPIAPYRTLLSSRVVSES